VLINHPYWFTNPFPPLQWLSWFLLALSIFFVTQAVILLKRQGGYAQREETPKNQAVENTVRVVDEEFCRYVRHPMYSSLLFLPWVAFCRHITPVNTILTVPITTFLLIAARIEENENENIRFFGVAYIGLYAALTDVYPLDILTLHPGIR
jgi:protein-S-isoprenylcysteine O-methyltransferase Ste14